MLLTEGFRLLSRTSVSKVLIPAESVISSGSGGPDPKRNGAFSPSVAPNRIDFTKTPGGSDDTPTVNSPSAGLTFVSTKRPSLSAGELTAGRYVVIGKPCCNDNLTEIRDRSRADPPGLRP